MPAKFTFSSPLRRSWLLIHQTHRLLEKLENRIFDNIGLSARRHAVLLAIKNLPAPLKVTDVAQWLDRNPNGISMLVDRMEKDGLVIRESDESDRRATLLTATSKGEKLFEESSKQIVTMRDEVFSDFTEEELLTLCNLLSKVQQKGLSALNREVSLEDLDILD